MGWPQNPYEFFNKPLTVYPMTNPTPQTPPEPPAAGELSDEKLLLIAADALDYDSIAPGEPDVMLVGPEELIAFARAAIAADRAQRPQAEQMAEALRRLWRWGGRHGWDSQTFRDVCDWIEAGMTGPLPPLPDHIARREVQF